MTDEHTPLQRLDDAVDDFVRAQQFEDGSTLAGWVLVYQRTALDPTAEERGYQPVKWGNGYAIAPGLSDYAALGLLDVVHEHIRLVGVEMLRHEDPDQEDNDQ